MGVMIVNEVPLFAIKFSLCLDSVNEMTDVGTNE